MLDPNLDQISFYNSQKLNDNNFQFTIVTDEQVLQAISLIKSKATGVDGINILTIKLCLPFLLPYITHIVNSCISMSVFPNMWKKARVSPLPKVPNACTLDKLRPISILPTLSKVLEKILDNQLELYFQKNNIIPENQSGFSRGRSCNTALQNITDDIIGAIDQGKLTVLILLDYSRAFDTLNHEILKSMYGYAGFSNEATTLLTNYLHGRMQAVYYGGKLSNFESTNNGVPQGTILGPRMYTFYTSTFSNALLSCNSHYYADDTQMYLSFYLEEASQAVAALNYDLLNVVNFGTNHCLKLNSDKSVAVIFGGRMERQRFIDDYSGLIQIQNREIKITNIIKNLGLHIDNDLRFTEHITKCLQKAYCNLRLIFQQRHVLNRQVKSMSCDSLVLSPI